MRRPALALLVAGLLAATSASAAEDAASLLEEAGRLLRAGEPAAAFETARRATIAISQRMPFTVRRAVLVTRPVEGYGMYEPRKDGRFRSGEPVLVYAEPAGYRIAGDGPYRWGFAADVAIATPDGEVLAGRSDFGNWVFTSREPNLETYLMLTLEFDGLPAGAYRIVVVLRDRFAEDAATRFTLPIEILE